MQHIFELYLTSDKVSKEQWEKFYKTITQYIGKLAKCQVIIAFQDNVVKYYVASDKDLGQLSNNIEIGVLRPTSWESMEMPTSVGKEGFVHFVTGGNLLDLKEKLAVKRTKQLDFVLFNCRRISDNKSLIMGEFYFKDAANHWTVSKKPMTFFPSHLLSVDFETNTHYLRTTPPKYVSIEKTIQLFEPSNVNAVFSVSTFPYFSKDYYLPLTNYEFDKHSFIVGATGSGKSKFIQLYVEKLAQSQLKMNYRVIIVDPHDSLRNDLEQLDDSYIVNFANESAELFGGDVQTDVTAATELTTSLMKSLLADQFNARLERVLRFSLFVLFVGQTMSLDFLKRFLTELELRNQVLKHVEQHIPSNIRQFFVTDFNEIRTTYYNEAILPIVSLVDEMQLQPTLVNENQASLARLIQNNFLTVFSMNKVSMGDKVVKTVAGLLVQQIFLLAQAHAFNEKIILIVDEVSIVQNPAFASILAEARKFNLSLILTQQYFGQVEKDLRDAIFANVYNYYAFRVSEEDAETLSGNLEMEIPKEIIEAEAVKGVKEEQIKVKLLTELHPRECMVRISADGKVLPCFKARTVDATINPKQQQIKANDLKTYKQPGKPKLKKFVESDAPKASEMPEFSSQPAAAPSVINPTAPTAVPASALPKSNLEGTPLASTQSIKPAETKPVEAVPKEPATEPKTAEPSPQTATLPMESEPATTELKDGMEFGGSSNPEADISIVNNPEIDVTIRNLKKQQIEEAATKIGTLAGHGVIAKDNYNQPTISLSELLASQSSSRET